VQRAQTGSPYTPPTRIEPPPHVSARVLILLGLLFLAIYIATGFWTNPPIASQPPTSAVAQSQKVVVLRQRLDGAKKLLAAAKKERHPVLIYRSACQIPIESPEYSESAHQVSRADGLSHIAVAKLRKEAARRLQDGYYEQGKRIDVRVIEGDEPTLQLQYVLFDETSAYVAKSEADTLAETLLPLGFHSISFIDGFGHGSSFGWESADVKRAEFGDVHKLCEQVRAGELDPDTLNATVKNPTL
jgi:hypothetical protein